MRLAVSGSHGTGKSTLIAAFVAACPHYISEPEAFELLADEIVILRDEGPDADGLGALIEHTVDVVTSYPPGASVVFERSPIDYLAFAVATLSMAASERADILDRYVPVVRDAIRYLDWIVLLPGSLAARPGDDEGFRDRVTDALRRVLIDDELDLFGYDAPRVTELLADPECRLAELMRYAEAER